MLVTVRCSPAFSVSLNGAVAEMSQAPQVFCEGHATARAGGGSDWKTEFLDANGLRGAIAAAYATDKDSPGRSLDGTFCYLVVDPVRRRIVAGCDPLGKCRLFHAQPDPSTLVIATSLEALLAEVGGSAIDEEYVADVLARSWHLGSRTPFASCSKLASGAVLHWPGRPSGSNWWDNWRIEAPLRLGTPDDYAERLRLILDEAVVASVADVPLDRLGCELSGGLDSSTVYALIRRNRPVASLSYVYPRSAEANENRYIKAALADDQSRWFAIDADAAAPFTADFPRPLAEPANALIFAGWIAGFAAAATEAGVSTILTGLGGDSVLHGDHPAPLHIADLLRTGHWRRAVGAIRAWQNGHGGDRGLSHWLLDAGVQPLGRWMINRLLAPGAPLPPWISAEYKRSFACDIRDVRRHWPRQPSVAATQQMDGVRLAIHGIATFYAPQSPIAFRHPLLSLPLIEFMQRLPTSLRLSPECDRLLQRHAMAGILPDAIRLRSSKGGPNQAIFAGLARSPHWQQKLCDDPIVAQRGYVDREKWRAAVRLFAHGETRSLRMFLATAVLEAWFQQVPAAWTRTDHCRHSTGTVP